MTVNPVVTPVSSLDNDDNNAAAAATATFVTGENHEWYYSKLLHGQHLCALDIERLKDNRVSDPYYTLVL
jgi:hypothetical protein